MSAASVFANQFGFGCCGGGGSGGGTVNPPSCFCANVPETLALTSCGWSQFGFYQSASLIYGFPPQAVIDSCLNGGVPSDYGKNWWSGPLVTDILGPDQTLYYELRCTGFDQWVLSGFTIPIGVVGEGGTFGYCFYGLAQWQVITANNTCSPFALTSGCYPAGFSEPDVPCVTINASGPCRAAGSIGGGLSLECISPGSIVCG